MEFDGLISLIKGQNIQHMNIFLHNNADPDAICAAFAMVELIRAGINDIEFTIFADGIGKICKNIIADVPYSVNSTSPSNKALFINITLDLANYIQLGKYQSWIRESSAPLVVIDHHTTIEVADKADISIADSNAGSTCMIITRAFEELGLTPSPEIATLLLTGHIYDSRRFLHGTNEASFQSIAHLIKVGGDYDKANRYLQNEPSKGERVARMKAMRRVNYVTVGEVVVATSRIGAYEASVARGLITLGADVVFVIANKNTEIRGSARVRNSIDLDIAAILTIIAKEFHGKGGGHAQAAGINIKRNVNADEQKQILEKFIELVRLGLNDV